MPLVLPQLVQSKCNIDREDSHSQSIVTLNTPTKGYNTNEDESDIDQETDSSSSDNLSSSEPSDTFRQTNRISDDDENDTDSSSSSDWEPSISMASTYLPRKNKKSNPKLELKTYNSFIDGDKQNMEVINTINIIDNILFYPFRNLQSLLFSHLYPYIENDYKKIKNVNIINDDEDEHNHNNTSIEDDGECMNWNDNQSVQKISELIQNLLISASLTVGIREDELYLMFSSPSPQEIIEHLRFGQLSLLCDVHIDRFGRRSYHRKDVNVGILEKEEAHFYNHSHIPSALFGANDISNLSNFIQESPTIRGNCDNHLPFGEYGDNHMENQNNMDRQNGAINIDHKPMTYLLTNTKTTTYNIKNPRQNAMDIGHKKHRKSKTTHGKLPLYAQLQSLPERKEAEYNKNKPKSAHTTNTKNNQKRTKSKAKSKGNKHKKYRSDFHGKVRHNHHSKKGLSVQEFKSIDLMDILDENDCNNDHYLIAKRICGYFDLQFGDKDTVCLVSSMNKQPAISYWMNGDYVRKDRNVLINGDKKYILIYRACKHIQAKQPILSQNEFEIYVKDICNKYRNKCVDFICDKLDDTFGDGCHFAKSKCKKSDYDIYCRFSDKYECSFKMKPNNEYIVAWRR